MAHEEVIYGDTNLKGTIMDEYREAVLKAIREYERQFDHVDQYEITNAIAELYEIIRAIKTD